jgi:hypothetical protein
MPTMPAANGSKKRMNPTPHVRAPMTLPNIKPPKLAASRMSPYILVSQNEFVHAQSAEQNGANAGDELFVRAGNLPAGLLHGRRIGRLLILLIGRLLLTAVRVIRT